MMNIAMAKFVVSMVETSGAGRHGREDDDIERAEVALAKAGAWSPLRWVLARWHGMRGGIAPASGVRMGDVTLAATAIAAVQAVMPSQPVMADGLNMDRATITDSHPAA